MNKPIYKKKKSTMLRNLFSIIAIMLVGITCYFAGFYVSKETIISPENSKVESVKAVEANKQMETGKQESVATEVITTTKNNTNTKVAENKPIQPVSSETYNVEIVKSQFKLYLKQNENIIKQYDVGIGKNPGQKQRSGDLTTPTGNFYVDEIIDATHWTHDFKDGKGEIAGAYGPWFISLETGWDGIGIHGTHDPKSIGTMVSEGCIRMNNKDVAELKAFAKPSTKVIIRE